MSINQKKVNKKRKREVEDLVDLRGDEVDDAMDVDASEDETPVRLTKKQKKEHKRQLASKSKWKEAVRTHASSLILCSKRATFCPWSSFLSGLKRLFHIKN